MRSLAALVVAPLLALTDQSVAYAFVGWACAHQHAMGGVHAVFLAATLLLAVAAARSLSAAGGPAPGREGEPGDRRMLALLALLASLLACLVIAAMWIPHFAIAPCSS